jgi:hypothetical protein
VLKCKSCGAGLDLTMSTCPACGVELELGRLTGILGIVCRACDAYNEPGARACAACGAPIGAAAASPPPAGPEPAAAGPASEPPAAPTPPPVADRAAGPSGDAPTPAALTPVSHTPPAAAPSPPSRSVTPPGQAGPASTALPGQPVVRAFQKGAPAATRFVPLVASAAGAIPVATHCPRCGEDAGPGQFCQRCGQPLGAQGALGLQRPAPPRTATAVFGPLAPGRAKLVLERGEGLEGATFRLNADRVEAGRSQGQVVFPADPCLGPLHATFFYRDGALHVRDEGAPGGLYLRLRGPSVPLRPGDLFVVGDRLLRFAGPLPAAPPAPPDGTRRLGAPRPATPAAVLEEWMEGGVGGRVFVRGGPSVTIGRAGCSVNLGDDPYLSQAHAELLLEAEGGARLRDLGSSNGTYVRVPPHAERELHDGDLLRMGREVLRVAIA